MPREDAPANEHPDGELPAPGSRSGSGAQSVLPYLTKTLQAKPASSVDPRDATRPPRNDGHNPVFRNWPPRPQG